jgi:uncharacterized protein YbjT (DUF2867 family)
MILQVKYSAVKNCKIWHRHCHKISLLDSTPRKDELLPMKIAITGANSSVGKALLAQIAKETDLTALAGVRSERTFSSLPRSERIEQRVISYDRPADLAASLGGSAVLVHLAGILIESHGSTYQAANVDATAAVVRAARQAEVKHIVFISVIGANSKSSNRYFRSKGDAEKVVAESGISATIIRTPFLIGAGTAGTSSILGAASNGTAKLLGGGNYYMRPLDVTDLVTAILNCCRKQPAGVQTHELVGPESIAYHELITRTAANMAREVAISSIPVWSAKILTAITSRIKGGGISPTVIDVITADEIVDKNADEALGVKLTPLATSLEKILPIK